LEQPGLHAFFPILRTSRTIHRRRRAPYLAAMSN
jgi:hypothetical protein